MQDFYFFAFPPLTCKKYVPADSLVLNSGESLYLSTFSEVNPTISIDPVSYKLRAALGSLTILVFTLSILTELASQ